MQDLRQFLVLDDSTETEECEEVVKQIHEAADSDDTSSEKDSDDSTSSEATVNVMSETFVCKLHK